jgi:cobalt-zinc-cadmium efflux system protein
VALSLLILNGAWRLMRESTDILLEAVPAHIAMGEVEARMQAVPGVAAVHDLHVWTVTNGMVAMSGHAVVPDLSSHPAVLAAIQAALRGLGIGHVTIQLEAKNHCAEAEAEAVLAGVHAHHGHTH